jgi:type VII secretion protein EccB
VPAESLTKAQVQAYRYGMRRLETAVTSGQPYRRGPGGPRSGLSLLVGFILAALVLAGFAVYGFIKPAPSIGDATVLIDSEHGGAYVLRGGRLHPALNLASALLAAGNQRSENGTAGNGTPVSRAVSPGTLAKMAKGQALGISGAPNRIPGRGSLVPGTWTVCDTSRVDPAEAPSQPPRVSTTVVLGQRVDDPSAAIAGQAVLVTPDGGRTEYLLRAGRRSAVPPGDQAVALALGLADVTARPISLGLLDAIPAGPALTVPRIDRVGSAVPWASQLTVGTVFRVHLAREDRDYVALASGAQQLSPVTSDLLRAANGTLGAAIPTVPLATLKQAATVHELALDGFPTLRPTYFDVATAPDVCLSWEGGAADGAATGRYFVYPTTAVPLPSGARPVSAPPNSAPGSADAVYLAPGHGAVIGQVTGDQKAPTGALFLVTDDGVKFPVVSAAALTSLGLGRPVYPAPPALLGLLPTGPTLDPAAASQYVPAAGG